MKTEMGTQRRGKSNEVRDYLAHEHCYEPCEQCTESTTVDSCSNGFQGTNQLYLLQADFCYCQYTGGTVIEDDEDEDDEITGKATAALWGYATLPTNALKCGLVDYKWRHRGDFRIFISSKRN